MYIRLEPSTGVPITRQISEQIRMLCAAGAIKPGTRIPSVRKLAQQLAVNQNTVLRVYERLTAEGFLERRHGDGTYVADKIPADQLKDQITALRHQLAGAAHHAKTLGIDSQRLHAMVDEILAEIPAAAPADQTKRI